MIIYKTKPQIELIRKNCHLVCKTLALVASNIKPGVSLKKLDSLAEEFIRDNDSLPGFKGYQGFPATLCMSKNHEVVHGIPTDYELREADIISIDCGVYANNYFGDAAYTFAIVGTDEATQHLLEVTQKSLYLGIEQAKIGSRLGNLGNTIQKYCESHGYSVVQELVGHGLGTNLHEDPQVPNYGRRGLGKKIKEGLVIAIEPMINLGKRHVHQLEDNWTICTKDGKPSAHFEHTIAVTKSGPDILSDHSYIKDELKNNPYLLDI